MSEKLLSLLKKDELEAVMAHELAHIKNSDTTLKALVTAYKTFLPIDPVVRLVEAAFHREREMAADETAAKTTKKPLSLASALLKIYEAFPKPLARLWCTVRSRCRFDNDESAPSDTSANKPTYSLSGELPLGNYELAIGVLVSLICSDCRYCVFCSFFSFTKSWILVIPNGGNPIETPAMGVFVGTSISVPLL